MAIARRCGLGGLLVVLGIVPLMAAEEADEASASQWDGAAELGFIMNRGNTDSDSLNAQLRVENSHRKWRHRGEAKVLRISEEDTTTAESYEVSGRSEYLLDDNDYLFGTLRYESDEFAGYDQRTTEVLGYGHQFLKKENMHLKGEFGAGGRQTEFVDGTDDNESIVRVGLDYKWQISKTSSFSEVVFVEHGSNNTYTESVTALTAKINNSLAMKVSYTIKNNSDPQAGFETTDTRTAVTLVYDF
ncbi:MAG: DUF481 domain-containing protein [Thiohalophilus sp.]|uniref:DUF481 domain-containing protein n=1 Tax=Thiohalophilus sp. TaxID=3028392 RepID=UPI002870622B|nr:DUF481 domain-containing protein [Thiohalophilus sp.]MDR9436743.1 DUF481 domain-containing protein [Thiohalophilus sp.]